MLVTSSLTFAYDTQNQFSFPDLKLQEEDNLLIIGESGVGKTTFLHLLAGLLPAKSGSIHINDTDLTHCSSSEVDRFRGQHIGIIFQNSHFIRSLTLMENLLLVQYLAGKRQNQEQIHELLGRLGMVEKSGVLPRQLSQGQRQRASVAMALINRPVLLLADEPTSSLDDKNCEQVVHLLKAQSKYSKAHLVIITHDQRVKKYFQNIVSL